MTLQQVIEPADNEQCSRRWFDHECEAGRRQHLAELHFVVLTNLRNSGGAGWRRRYFFPLTPIVLTLLYSHRGMKCKAEIVIIIDN
jgi:hypothetical protein